MLVAQIMSTSIFNLEVKKMSIRVTLDCQIKTNKHQELIKFLEDNLPNVRGFKGNLRVSVLFDMKNTNMLLDEEWLSVEDHEAYLKYVEQNGVLGMLNSYLKYPPQITYYFKKEI
jgi:quinol monooxygenase YgiN